MEGIQDGNTEQSLSPTSSDTGDTGDTHVVPRVGDQYQANVPTLSTEYDPLQLKSVPRNSKVTFDTHWSFVLGLPIPLMWSKAEIKNINGTVESVNSEESQVTSKNECQEFQIQPLAISSNQGNDLGDPSFQLGAASNKMKFEPKSKMNKVEDESCPLPGITSGFWTDIERDSFLLGLYIFGKNLILVEKFVESKDMGGILTFYYGCFYRSDEYRRWSECRKLRSRRNVQGQKIFTGWRQQELLSRLLSRVSQERHHILLEVFRSYGEGKIAFEESIFALKHEVGINVLVEAIGIGKGKQDLTSVAIEPKSNHVTSVRSEIPIGKACSSLSSADIIKFLTGDFRLSKARTSDLFWEAVWPRLLARGWHSEQPKDQAISGSKYSLVFLVPGVKKFSRRRLVKGNHYFDSVSDVLNKVASDPGLLELQVESAKGNQNKDECRWDPPLKEDQDSLSNKRHCYLQPRNLNCSRNVQKFTIVDTSLAYETERPKVIELRSLPLGDSGASSSSSSSISSESEEDTSEESEEEGREIKMQNPKEDQIDGKAICDSSDCVNSIRNSSTGDSLDPISAAAEIHEIESLCLVNDQQQGGTAKHQFSCKVKSDHPKYLVPLRKQQSFIDCNNEQSNSRNKNTAAETKLNEDESHCTAAETKLNEDESHCTSNSRTFEDIICTAQNSSSATSLGKVSPDRHCEAVVGDHCQGSEVQTGKPHSPKLIDLNVPHVSSDFEDEPIMKEVVQNNDSLNENEPSLQSKMNCQSDPDVLNLSDAMAAPWDPPVLSSRRHSTRSRPLTTKALEAMELGFFNTKKRKSGNSLANNKMSMCSRRVRGRTTTGGNANDGVHSNAEDPGGGEVLDSSYSNADTVDESGV